MSQYLISCDTGADKGTTCSMVPYQAPAPAPEHGFQHTTLVIGMWAAVVVVVFLVVAVAAVRWKAHSEKNATKRERLINERELIKNPLPKCPVCGVTNELPETLGHRHTREE